MHTLPSTAAVLVSLFTPAAVLAQDGTQQMLLQTQQVEQLRLTQEINTNTQMALQQSADQNAIAAQAALSTTMAGLPAPHLSAKSGQYSGSITVSIRTRVRKAQIFYTVDGWTPTPLSRRYNGPITIYSSTTLKAVAFLPHNGRSAATSARYTLQMPTNAQLEGPETVRVVFTTAANSGQVHAGDSVPLALVHDVHWHGQPIPAGTPVKAVITHVHQPAWSGTPASISFSVLSVATPDVIVRLSGGATEDGPEKAVGRGWPFDKGQAAEILKGAELTVHVVVG